MRLLDFPNEILLKTFKYADWKDLPSLFSTCKRLNAFKQDIITKKNIDKSKLGRALIMSVGRGYLESTQSLLLDHNVDINFQNEFGFTALMLASVTGHTEIVKLLLCNELQNRNPDVNIQDHRRYTALMWASRYGHTEIVKLLLGNGANVNIQDENGYTALILASKYGPTETVKLLLDHNADVNHQNRFAETALMWISVKGHTDIVELLNSHGAWH